jgi:hypothetical protein
MELGLKREVEIMGSVLIWILALLVSYLVHSTEGQRIRLLDGPKEAKSRVVRGLFRVELVSIRYASVKQDHCDLAKPWHEESSASVIGQRLRGKIESPLTLTMPSANSQACVLASSKRLGLSETFRTKGCSPYPTSNAGEGPKFLTWKVNERLTESSLELSTMNVASPSLTSQGR